MDQQTRPAPTFGDYREKVSGPRMIATSLLAAAVLWTILFGLCVLASHA